ncbi:beta-lactamase/transpeptidase-like protein [Stemphylium lycopersici]|uniref:Beta-lactamase/transpeptidase-like protein n=1 Tax=Stemphylium lycopersici TaxID=183478 RepID=A0A364NAV5_STELY|nr:beta-lactamase/transpeptidase-like protein [Stemphylium lycopersici]
MASFETLINDAVAKEDIPGCALIATNRDGTFEYSKSFGKTSIKPENTRPMQLDTIMWVASCTKLMTSLCAMQLVERGLVTLDEPVYKHIPELESFNVLKGFTDAGEPIEEKHKQPITLRTLLTHTSGLTYDGMHPNALAWLKYYKRGPSRSGKLLERFSIPLIFEPGESWAYGPSIDYAGLLVERISNQSLEEYMKANLWEPLGICDVTFFPSTRPDLKARMADMCERDAQTGKLKGEVSHVPYLDGEGKEVTSCMGGQGSFTCAAEYIKVLKAVLQEGEGKILSQASYDEFFKPQLGEGSKAMLNAVLQDDMANNAMGGLPQNLEKDWGLGGILLMADSPDGKKAGTMLWGGYPNLIWWVDRKTGLCGLYAGQVVPPGDPTVAALNRKFEAFMYEMLEKEKGEARL